MENIKIFKKKKKKKKKKKCPLPGCYEVLAVTHGLVPFVQRQ